jgi:hypothetical protein
LKPKKIKTNTRRNGQFNCQKGGAKEESNITKGRITRATIKKRSVALNIMKIDLNFNPLSPIIWFEERIAKDK